MKQIAFFSLAFAAVMTGIVFGVVRAAGGAFEIPVALTLYLGLAVASMAVQYLVDRIIGLPWLK